MIEKLPSEYKPFKQVWVCNNHFNNGNIIFEVDHTPIFLIGRGGNKLESLLWFNIPSSDENSRKWRSVISKNKCNDPAFKLITSKNGNEVNFNEKPLLQFKLDGNKLIINMIDFRSIGLNIFGGLSSFNVIGNSFTNNTFNNVNTMMSIGE